MTVVAKLAWTQFEGDKTLMWRAQQLHDAGLTEAQAAWLALCKVDLHEALAQIEFILTHGGDPETAFDILAD